jgi:hypothetical protein
MMSRRKDSTEERAAAAANVAAAGEGTEALAASADRYANNRRARREDILYLRS